MDVPRIPTGLMGWGGHVGKNTTIVDTGRRKSRMYRDSYAPRSIYLDVFDRITRLNVAFECTLAYTVFALRFLNYATI